MAQGQQVTLLSGKVKKVPSANADPNRYSFLNLQNAEPDLGVPSANGSFFTSTTTGTRSWTSAITASGSQILIENLAVNGESNLGSVGNVLIYGGNSGQALVTDGNGNLSWATTSGVPGGSNTAVQFNSNGNFGGSNVFTYDDSNNVLTAPNIVISGTTDLGDLANVTITGGSANYVITTDGAGNLSWTAQSGTSNLVAPMPYYIATACSYTVSNNFQGLFSVPIEIDGNLTVDGVLVQVEGALTTTNGQIIFNQDGNLIGDSNLMFYQANTTFAANNLTALNSANLGNVGNLTITGGSAGYYLQTDGAGNLSWAAGGGGGNGSPGGANTYVQYNNAGSFSGSSAFVFNESNYTVTVTNFIALGTSNVGPVGNLTITGGSPGQVLTTDGSGTLTWTTVSGGGGGGGGANITVDNFTGNGVETTYTLSVTPANIDQTQVNYNGVILLKNAYSLSGANITFDDAPANGAEIEVSTFEIVTLDTSTISNGTSNVSIPVANSNIYMYVAGSETMRVSSNGIKVTGQSNLGAVANVYISGGSNGQALVTDGSGNLTWSNVAGEPGGFNTYVQFNDSGNFAGSGRFLFNKVGNTLTVSNVNILGNANVLSFTTGGGNSVNFAVPNTANNTTFIVPNTSGTSQQVLGITDQSTQQLGWKTVPVNYVTVELRNTYSYLSSPVPVLRVYPIRTRSGTFLDLTVTQ